MCAITWWRLLYASDEEMLLNARMLSCCHLLSISGCCWSWPRLAPKIDNVQSSIDYTLVYSTVQYSTVACCNGILICSSGWLPLSAVAVRHDSNDTNRLRSDNGMGQYLDYYTSDIPHHWSLNISSNHTGTSPTLGRQAPTESVQSVLYMYPVLLCVTWRAAGLGLNQSPSCVYWTLLRSLILPYC